jgi:hypothetical protein
MSHDDGKKRVERFHHKSQKSEHKKFEHRMVSSNGEIDQNQKHKELENFGQHIGEDFINKEVEIKPGGNPSKEISYLKNEKS